MFSGIEGNSRDIFVIDLKSKAVRNLTNDPEYDEAPVFSPDGKFVYHSKIVAGFSKIVRFPLDDPSKAEQVTWGDGNDEDPSFSPDGKRIYFTSSRGGIYNIYGQDLASGEIFQYTDVIGAALGPAAFLGPDGQEKIVFSGFQGLRFQLYAADAKKPFRKLDERALPPAPVKTGGTAGFVPAVEVAVDPEKLSRPKFKMFLDNAQVLAGINSDQTFVSQVLLSFSDYLGDRRAFFQFDSVSTFSNFRVGFFNIAKRFQWGVQLYDDREYFYGVQLRDRRLQPRSAHRAEHRRLRERLLPDLALHAPRGKRRLREPLSRRPAPVHRTSTGHRRSSTSRGRTTCRPRASGSRTTRRVTPASARRAASGSTSTSSTRLRSRRARRRSRSTPSRRGGSICRFRGACSSRSAPSAASRGARRPTVFYFGGLDTLRGYDYRSIIGNNVFYVNTEFRFPLVDVLATPILQFGGVRGRIFLDVGGGLAERPVLPVLGGRAAEGRACVLRCRLQRLLPRPAVERGLLEAVGLPLVAVGLADDVLHRDDFLGGARGTLAVCEADHAGPRLEAARLHNPRPCAFVSSEPMAAPRLPIARRRFS